jgi:hypothetical protein
MALGAGESQLEQQGDFIADEPDQVLGCDDNCGYCFFYRLGGCPS